MQSGIVQQETVLAQISFFFKTTEVKSMPRVPLDQYKMEDVVSKETHF